MNKPIETLVNTIDTIIDIFKAAKHDTNKAIGSRVRIIKLAEKINNSSEIIGDECIRNALFIAVSTCEVSTDDRIIPFVNVKEVRDKGWFNTLGKKKVDSEMVDTLAKLRSAATGDDNIVWNKTSRGMYFMWICVYIREQYNTGSVDNVLSSTEHTLMDLSINDIRSVECYSNDSGYMGCDEHNQVVYTEDEPYTYTEDYQVIYTGDNQVVYTEDDQVGYTEDAQVFYTEDDQVVYTEDDQVIYTCDNQDVYTEDDQVGYTEDAQVFYTEDDQVGYTEDAQVFYTEDNQVVYTEDDQVIYTGDNQVVYTGDDQVVYTEDELYLSSDNDANMYIEDIEPLFKTRYNTCLFQPITNPPVVDHSDIEFYNM